MTKLGFKQFWPRVQHCFPILMILAIEHTSNTGLPFLSPPFKGNSSSMFWTTYAPEHQEIRKQDSKPSGRTVIPNNLTIPRAHASVTRQMQIEATIFFTVSNERRRDQFCQFYWTNKIPTNNNEINSAGINVIQFNKTHCSVTINRFSKCHKKCSYELLTG